MVQNKGCEMENSKNNSNSVARKSQKRNDSKGLNPLEADRSGVRMIISRVVTSLILSELKSYLEEFFKFLLQL